MTQNDWKIVAKKNRQIQVSIPNFFMLISIQHRFALYFSLYPLDGRWENIQVVAFCLSITKIKTQLGLIHELVNPLKFTFSYKCFTFTNFFSHLNFFPRKLKCKKTEFLFWIDNEQVGKARQFQIIFWNLIWFLTSKFDDFFLQANPQTEKLKMSWYLCFNLLLLHCPWWIS